MPTPRVVLALTLRAAEQAGIRLADMQDVQKLMHKMKERLPDVYAGFVFSEFYPYPWSYEVEDGMLSLLTDGYVVWVGLFQTCPEVKELCERYAGEYEKIREAITHVLLDSSAL